MDYSSEKNSLLQDYGLTPLSCPHCKIDFGMIPIEQFNTHLKSCHMAPSNQDYLPNVLATPTISNAPGKKAVVPDLSKSSVPDSSSLDLILQKANEDGEVSSIDLPCSYGPEAVMTGVEYSNDPYEVARGRYKSLTDPQLFVNALENPKTRSLSSLHQIVSNACDTLATWQKEYKTVVRKLGLAETSVSATQPYIPKRDPMASGSLEIHDSNGDAESNTPRRRASPKKRVLQPTKERIPHATRQPRALQLAKEIDTDTGISRTPSVAAPKARPGRKRKSDETDTITTITNDLPLQPLRRKRTKLNISTDVSRAPSVGPSKASPKTASRAPAPAALKAPPKPMPAPKPTPASKSTPTPKPRVRKRKSSDTDATIELAVEAPPQRKRVKIEDLLITPPGPVAEPPKAPPAPVAVLPKKKGRPFKNKPPTSLPPLASLLPAPAESSSLISTTAPTPSVRSTRARTSQAKTPVTPAPPLSPAPAKKLNVSAPQPTPVSVSTPEIPKLPPPPPTPRRPPLTTPILPATIDISSLPAGAPSTPLDIASLPSGAAQPSSLIITLHLRPSLAAFSKLAAAYPTSPVTSSVPTSTSSSSLPTITLATSPPSDKIVVKTEKGGKTRKDHLDIDPLTGKNKTRSEAMLGVWAARKARGTNGRHGGKPIKER